MSITAPTNTGVGVGPSNPAPANLGRSAMASGPGSTAAAPIPFTRGSTDATTPDAQTSMTIGGTPLQVQLQTNAFLSALDIEFKVTTSGNSADVAFTADAPWNLIQQISLSDPSGVSIIDPISGYGLYLLNKYLQDYGCNYDAKLDPNYLAVTGTAADGGTISFRLTLPIEVRHRDAFGALNNSSANQRYLLTIVPASGASVVYSTAPTTVEDTIDVNITQHYWTSPPATITTSSGTVQVAQTPTGLGTVAFVRYERHNEVSGGGTPPIQLTNVGDYISQLVFVLRNSSAAREQTDWPSVFYWWINDFQTQALPLERWQRLIARFYDLKDATFEAAGGLDTGVFVMPSMNGLFDKSDNFAPANQYLPTNATTKLQVRGSIWGSSASYLEVYSRLVRPSSGAALFA